MVKSMDKRSALERVQCAFEQKRGTPLTKKDVAEVWGEIVRLRELVGAAMAQTAPIDDDHPPALNISAAMAAMAELDDEVR
jgi:hypothetical protein